ncbi:hypothetical protein OIU77_013582 [Salix suchowensis]|uniref:laccase n=1 Tax=Salix suchowensis TaxID=1278906 RepID=A0ABQ8ZUP6_9ROSI|nr:hypothetical protein OIU77_013582 [Salix suchowensis]
MEHYRARTMLLVIFIFPALLVECKVRLYNFRVVQTNTTKLCSTKSIVTINGKFPGPTIYAREDDNVNIRLTNKAWSEAVAYGLGRWASIRQRGTLLWHAHISWLRATIHGAIVILPKKGVPYPFPKPDKEKIIILSEWWKADVEAVINQSTITGLPPNISDAHTVNGQTGAVPGCISPGFTLHVDSGKIYLLRIINAALNDELFFKIAGHNITVVEVDATYTKPFSTDTIFIGPGQTTNALLTADKSIGKYLIAVSPFMDTVVAVDNVTAIAFLRYKGTLAFSPPVLTTTPAINATPATSAFTDKLRSLNSKKYPVNVPLTVDHNLYFTIGVGIDPCATCTTGSHTVGDINNVSFIMPTKALLEAHYYNISGVFTDDFPAKPPISFNYTGNNTAMNLRTTNGTRAYRLAFNSTVQIVLQGTTTMIQRKFNLADPVERNTVSVPTAGWIAIRFKADNPGVWFLHCHLEVHTTWGLKMAFVVDNGKGPDESILPPPSDLPTC